MAGRRWASIGAYEVACLKICPKRAVTVVNGADPGRWMIVPAGTPAADVAAQLGIVGRDAGGDAGSDQAAA
jgi:hypothetical protein